jgi:ribosomal protein L7/L12
MTSPRPIKQAVSDEETRILWQTREGMQGFLRELRNRGAFQIESIKAVCQLARVPLGEAKEIVHFSPVWEDMRAASEALHEAGFEALDQMQREDISERERVAG